MNACVSEPLCSLFTEECGESTIGQKISSFVLFGGKVPILPEIISAFIASFHFKAIKDQIHGLSTRKDANTDISRMMDYSHFKSDW